MLISSTGGLTFNHWNYGKGVPQFRQYLLVISFFFWWNGMLDQLFFINLVNLVHGIAQRPILAKKLFKILSNLEFFLDWNILSSVYCLIHDAASSKFNIKTQSKWEVWRFRDCSLIVNLAITYQAYLKPTIDVRLSAVNRHGELLWI